jgi:hypothetical protein
MKSGELLAGLAVCCALAGGVAWADDAATSVFGRIAAVSGAVQYQSGGGTWADALVNEPVAAGVGIRATGDAGAELHIAGIRVAVAGSSELRVARLDRDVLQIALSRGRIGLHLDPAGAAATVEVDLPRGAIWLAAPGEYDPGEYDIVAGEGREPARVGVFSGKALLGGGLDESHLAAATSDRFTESWRAPDAAETQPDAGHLSPVVAGAAALGAAGTWKHDNDLGDVWYPDGVAADWVPYRDGVWRFLAPGGWTWVDAAPWGFAPSHYGRWARLGERWGWVPGTQTGAPDYSPAQVAFLGTAPFGLSCPGETGPAMAWFPLGPGETVGDGNDYNYRNRRFASAVPRGVFAGGKPVAAALVDLPEQRFADAPVILGPLGVVPVPAGAKVAVVKHPVAVASAAEPPPRKPVVLRRLIAAAATPGRTRPPPSTSAARSMHNRQHLAARGRES